MQTKQLRAIVAGAFALGALVAIAVAQNTVTQIITDGFCWTEKVEKLDGIDLGTDKKISDDPTFDFEKFKAHKDVIPFKNGYGINLSGVMVKKGEIVSGKMMEMRKTKDGRNLPGRLIRQVEKDGKKAFDETIISGPARTPERSDIASGSGQERTLTANPALDQLRAKAEQGDQNAQYLLGIKYSKGDGVPQHKVQAYRWLHLAAESGWKEAIYPRWELANSMTQEEIAQAKRLAAGNVASTASTDTSKVTVGMSRDQVIRAIGKPDLTERTFVGQDETETWLYQGNAPSMRRTVLVFDGKGILKKIETDKK